MNPFFEVYFYGHSGYLLTPTLKLFETKILVAMLWGVSVTDLFMYWIKLKISFRENLGLLLSTCSTHYSMELEWSLTQTHANS